MMCKVVCTILPVSHTHTEPPQNVTLTATGSDKLEISWVPPPQTNIIVYFVVFEDYHTHYVNPTSPLLLHFEFLAPYTSYTGCVAANTTMGPTRLACKTQTTLQSGTFDKVFYVYLLVCNYHMHGEVLLSVVQFHEILLMRCLLLLSIHPPSVYSGALHSLPMASSSSTQYTSMTTQS